VGHHGLVTDVAAKLLDAGGFDMVLTCGPEVMMKKVVDTANAKGIRVQASLERYMKCGIGICDACGPDHRTVCATAPSSRARTSRSRRTPVVGGGTSSASA